LHRNGPTSLDALSSQREKLTTFSELVELLTRMQGQGLGVSAKDIDQAANDVKVRITQTHGASKDSIEEFVDVSPLLDGIDVITLLNR
jgi:hypothetical protein